MCNMVIIFVFCDEMKISLKDKFLFLFDLTEFTYVLANFKLFILKSRSC